MPEETERDAPLYDAIGVGYSGFRRPDPRIQRRLHELLGAVAPVINVGAGSGSYEPLDRALVAVEPSMAMIDQRPPGAPASLRAIAAQLRSRPAHSAGPLPF